MNIYTIGDLHLSLNPQTQKPMDIYGGAWINHSETLKENWNRVVKDDDIVVIVGDISWAMKLEEAMIDLQWVSKLNGTKVIFKGNHDLWWIGINRLNSLFDNMYFVQNDCFVVDKVGICGSRGWICPGSDNFQESDRKIYLREVARVKTSIQKAKLQGAEDIIGFLHYPPTNEKKQLSEFCEIFQSENVENVYFGHLHGQDVKSNRNTQNINGVSYKLVSYDALEGNLLKIY